MATVVSTAVTEISNGYNDENIITFQAAIGAATSGDTVTITLPSRWQKIGVGVTSVAIQAWTTSDLAGARTKASIVVTSYSLVEATGVLSVLIGASISSVATAIVQVCPSS